MTQVTLMGTGAAFSTRRRTNVALLVQEGDVNLVIECGPTILYQLDRAGMMPTKFLICSFPIITAIIFWACPCFCSCVR